MWHNFCRNITKIHYTAVSWTRNPSLLKHAFWNFTVKMPKSSLSIFASCISTCRWTTPCSKCFGSVTEDLSRPVVKVGNKLKIIMVHGIFGIIYKVRNNIVPTDYMENTEGLRWIKPICRKHFNRNRYWNYFELTHGHNGIVSLLNGSARA